MKLLRIRAVVFAVALSLAVSCTNHGHGIPGWIFGTGITPGTAFPSPGSAPAPEGSDLFSSTTNHSSAISDPETKADPLNGAVFIAPPEPNHYGGVSLSYPIVIPTGRAGVEPKLAISYSATGGDGWIGVGWNLGLGAITRTPEYGALFYNNKDTFTWNGARLVKISGPANSENGTYRPEILGEDSVVLKLSFAEVGGIWEVLDSSGTKTVYGESSSTRIYNPDKINQTYSWYVSKIEDRNGNTQEVEYDTSNYSSNRTLYLKEIRYTGNSKASLTPRQYVRFYTKSRDDFYVSKAPGFLMKMDRLLDKIEVGWSGGKLWDYTLVYTESSDSGRPILKTVESSRHTTQPEFSYQESSRQLLWQNIVNREASEPEDNPDSTQYFEGDFNGDGISDMLFFNPESGYWKAAEGRKEGGYNFKIYGNRYIGYEGPEKIRFFKGNVSGDFNGDGRSDIAFYLPETREFIVAEHDGRVFQFRSYGRMMNSLPDIFRMDWFPGDYDGNGLSDAILFDEPTGNWTLMLNKGGRFDFLLFSKKFQNIYREDYTPNGNLDSVSTFDTTEEGRDRAKVQTLVGDYNGDGRTDISFYDARNGKWIVGENYRPEDPLDPLPFRMQWKLYKVFTAPEQSLFTYDRFSGDFNGDGFSDFLLFDRSSGDWTIGETGDGTINFRTWSRVPQFREITRWLQGDFNGDGRTDIGFYSANDGKFWIGEATQNGFRYKIYSDMSYGPSATRVMQTPLPLDEVKLVKGTASFPISSGLGTLLLEYQYDGNNNRGRGELAFAGCFTVNDCSNSPELLLFDRKTGVFDFKKGSSFTESVLTGFSPEASDVILPFAGDPDRYTRSTLDEVLYYQKQGSVNKFRTVRFASGNSFELKDLASFTDTEVTLFHSKESGYVFDNFESTSFKSALILDDKSSTGSARFLLSGLSGNRVLTITGDLTPSNLYKIFQSGSSDNRLNRNAFSLFSGDFTGSGKAEFALVDRRTGTHKWYLGSINLSSNQIQFKKLSGDVPLPFVTSEYDAVSPAGIKYALYGEVTGHSILLGKASDVGTSFYKYRITSTSVTRTVSTANGVSFSGKFDHNGDPIVVQNGEFRTYDYSQGRAIALSSGIIQKSLSRPDLISKVYVFQWIQGDYNGDGLTDIGIIHLKEPTWYFALSNGIVPDIINKLKNGIGGFYEFEYENSTKFDNTGGDGIPDLPGTYRVCTKITADDGLGNRITKSYDYKNGFAFSSFINGKKESDFFGFSEFTMTDAYGARTFHTYNTTPYSDFMMNRALSGAEKQTKIIGSDNQEYGIINYTHSVQKIEVTSGAPSYLSFASKIEKYLNGSRTTTQDSSLTLSGYAITKKVESLTDHFADGAHSVETQTAITDFTTDSSTNQRRPTKTVSLAASANETTSVLTYDSKGNLTKNVTSYTGSGLPSTSPRILEYSYDSYGNTTQEKDSSGSPSRGTNLVYDSQLHQFVTERSSFGGSISFTTRSTIDYGSAFGLPLQITDPNGNKTYNTYDNYGRLTQVRADTDSGTSVIGSYSYHSSFPLGAKTILPSGTSAPDFAYKKYSDGLGRTIYTVKSGSNGQYVRSGRVVYDSDGRVVRSSRADWASGSEIDSFALHLEEREPTLFQYDAIGRVKSTTLPLAAGENSATVISVDYNDPFETVEKNSSGTNKRTIKDARGRVLYVEDFATDGTQARIGFCFDIAGNRVKKSDLNDGSNLSCSNLSTGIVSKDTSGKNQAYWKYDAFGRLKAQSDPDLGVETFAYNAFGEQTSHTDARSITTTFAYDAIGRVVTKHIPEGDTVFTYDSASGSENSLGKLVRVEDSVQSKEFSYDKLGRIKKETRRILNIPLQNTEGPYITETEYDLLGRITKIDYPAHPINHKRLRACYSYGSAGYVTGISVDVDTSGVMPGFCGTDIVENIGYNEFGQTAALTLGNNVSTDYTYDAKGRLIRVHSSGDVSGTNKILQDAVYTFNSNNAITKIENTSTDYNTEYNYLYDGLNRILDSNGTYRETADNFTKQFKQSFSYSKNGNLTAKRNHDFATGNITDEWSYQYTNHQVLRIDSSKTGSDSLTMSYDASGNMVSQNDQAKHLRKQIEVDSQNRIVSVKDATGAVMGKYWYDEGGFRIRRQALVPKPGQFASTEVIYPSMYFGLEYEETDNTLRSINNVYLNGVRVAALNEVGAVAYFLTDQVDSVSQVLDGSAQTLTRTQYQPYGESFVQRGNLDFAPKYNSQELDPETNFYYYNARYYDPQIARFTSADSIIDGEYDTQGWNRFAYVKGNPVGAKDPTGHDIFLYFYSSESTESGAGHVAMGVGSKKNQTLYEANPVNSGPDRPMEKSYKHSGSMKEVLNKNHIGRTTKKQPDLILQLKTNSKEEDPKVRQAVEGFFKENENWVYNKSNCTDMSRVGLSKTKYKGGKEIVSTPTEFADKLLTNNPTDFVQGNIVELKGSIGNYKDGTGSAAGVIKNATRRKQDNQSDSNEVKRNRPNKIHLN
ncbi:hypothetical protein CH373_12445 [Leptospira perolatii]|uniref:Teneurin-like YD-shell domain-containing protein n=1 Tax=Leptospira perolatii TaxID=2023191 RepID=A0A2M9ZLA2_9LEPT|nr:SpvB/TcaC N-terminal domain-containing protein [Leptospira perolatii]PJZ70254.1 hypothetical protein CH360_06525 [Leptospira perolatii]PJZ72862.1 hypothetical protein CH373_12445 [Leptospira perolatii]